MLSVKEQVFSSAATNISKAQERQKLDYDRRHIFKTEYKPGDKVLCKNLRRDDRKGGWKEAAWKGPYVIKEVHTNNSVTLLGKNHQALRKKIPVANLNRYNSAVSSIGDSSDENPSDPIKQKSLHSDEYKTGTVDDQQSNKSYVSMEVVGEGLEPPPLIFAPINYAGYLSKVADFDPPDLHLAPPYGVTPFEFRRDLWRQKTRIPGLSCGFICVILRLVVLVELRLVSERHRQTERHRPMSSTAR